MSYFEPAKSAKYQDQRSSSYGETLNAEDDEVHVYDHFRAFDQFEEPKFGSNLRKQEVHFSEYPNDHHRVFGDSNFFQNSSTTDNEEEEEVEKPGEVSKSFFAAQNPQPSEGSLEDRARVSRLFYLQLYSSVLNAEKLAGKKRLQEARRKAKKLQNKRQNKLAFLSAIPWFSWTNVSGHFAARYSPNQSLAEEASPDPDTGDFGTVQDSYDLSLPMDQLYNARMTRYNDSNRGLRHPDRYVSSAVMSRQSRLSKRSDVVEPVLNTRMRNLSHFSFRQKENENIVKQKKHSCLIRSLLCSWPIYIGILIAIIALGTILLVFSYPQSLSSHYEEVYLPDQKPNQKPKISVCLSMPFMESKLRAQGVSSSLASFMLYSLSPFLPNPDILDNPDLLAELSTQYRRFVSRARRLQQRSSRSNQKVGLRKIMRSLAPSCQDIILSCQTGTGAIIRGADCCKYIFNGGKFVFGPQGLCLLGGDFARKSIQPGFPLASPGTMAKLTVVLNTTIANDVAVDHRVIPWEPTAPSGFVGATVHESEQIAYRDTTRDLLIRSGRTMIVNVAKRAVDNQSPLVSNSCASKPFNNSQVVMDDKSLYDHNSCRASVIQLIAEKSVNCSLISLPRVDKKKPVCGPLEGLALMYILREQGYLVTANSTLLNRFETTLSKHCPLECDRQYFEPEVVADIETDPRTAQQFGEPDPAGISILKFHYRMQPFILTKRYVPGTLILIAKLGSVGGCAALILLLVITFNLLIKWHKRKQPLLLKNSNSSVF